MGLTPARGLRNFLRLLLVFVTARVGGEGVGVVEGIGNRNGE